MESVEKVLIKKIEGELDLRRHLPAEKALAVRVDARGGEIVLDGGVITPPEYGYILPDGVFLLLLYGPIPRNNLRNAVRQLAGIAARFARELDTIGPSRAWERAISDLGILQYRISATA